MRRSRLEVTLRRWMAFKGIRWVSLCVIVVAAALMSVFDIGTTLEQDLRGLRDGLRLHPANGRVAVIEIDADSLSRMKTWPWPRAHYARLLDRLSTVRPDAVAFDVDFSSPSIWGDDADFARAIKRFPGTVILPTFRQSGGSASARDIESFPVPALKQVAFLASVNVHPDADGVLRRYSYGTMTAGIARPSMAAMLAGTSGRIDRQFTVDQAIDPATIPRISFRAVLDGTADLRPLEGKLVLIGATAIEMGDRYPVPVHGTLPGVVTQAQAVETLLSSSSVEPLSGLWSLGFLLLAGGSAMLVRRHDRRVTILLSCAATLVIAVHLTECAGIGTVAVVPSIAGLLGLALFSGASGTVHVMTTREQMSAETGLRGLKALAGEAASRPVCRVIAVTFKNWSEIGALLAGDQYKALHDALVWRITLGDPGREIFSNGSNSLVWLGRPDQDVNELGDELEAMARLFTAPIDVDGRLLLLRPHFGIAQGSGNTGADVARRAILTATRVEEGNEHWRLEDDSLASDVSLRQNLLADLPSAIAERQFWIAYQPQFHLATGKLASAEALLRWQHPVRGEISPGDFIPVLEAERRIDAVTLMVVDMVLEDIARWRASGLVLSVAVNISGELLTSKGFNGVLLEKLRRAGDLGRLLTLEVTETAALHNHDAAVEALNAYRHLGVEISIDDYGTGQSTLSYLRSFPASELKIDQSFVRGLASSRNDQALVRSTIDLAHQLGFATVAEGVEDQACFDLLADMGCDIVQGWHIGRPMPAEQFIAYLGTDPARLIQLPVVSQQYVI